MEELEQAVFARSHTSSIDAMVKNVLSESPPIVQRQDSESVTTTIALSIIEPGATSTPAQASTTSKKSSPTPSSKSSHSDSIISTTSAQTPTPTPTPSSSTSNIPLLIAPGSLSTIYSILPSSSPSPSAPASPNSKSSSGISVGAKVGIALGAIALVAAITCLLIMLHVKRRRRSLQPATSAGISEKKKRNRARNESTIEVGNLRTYDQQNLHQEPASPGFSPPPLQPALPPLFIRESAPFKYPRQTTPLSPGYNLSSDQNRNISPDQNRNISPDQHQLRKKASEDKEVVSPNLSIPQTSRNSNEKTGLLSSSATLRDPFRRNSQTSTSPDGPHELDTGERAELDAGYPASTISRTVSPETQREGTISRGATASSLRRPSNVTVESPRRSNHVDEDRMQSLRSRSNTIEEGEVSEDTYSPREARSNGQGRISPFSQRTHASQRTARTYKTDQSGRSFLDLD